jgi:hypothetical protein
MIALDKLIGDKAVLIIDKTERDFLIIALLESFRQAAPHSDDERMFQQLALEINSCKPHWGAHRLPDLLKAIDKEKPDESDEP